VRRPIVEDADRIEKLPQWAQSHILRLVQQLETAELALRNSRALGDGNTSTGIVVEPYGDYPRLLPKDATVRFWIEPDKLAIDVHMRQNMFSPGPPALYVSGYGQRGSSSLVIHPSASNGVFIGGTK
jgi:hypothetical protein